MTACEACTAAASDWTHGIYFDRCRGCLVRGLAAAPAAIRKQYLARLPAAEYEPMYAEIDREITRVAELMARATRAAVAVEA